MELFISILSLISLLISGVSLIIAMVSSHKAKAIIAAELANARGEMAGLEPRLASLIDRKVQDALIAARQTANEDAFELLQNTIEKERDAGMGSPLDIANFNNFAR